MFDHVYCWWRVALLVSVALLVACTEEEPAATTPPPNATAQQSAPASDAPASQHKVCLAISSDGLGDKGYNDMQYSALVAARSQYGFEMDIITMEDDKQDPAGEALSTLVGRDCTVVLAGQGWSMREAVDALAPVYPEVLFVVVDATPSTFLHNTAGTRFHVEEGAFLAGYLAASLSKTNVLASVGGKAVPTVLDFIQGFEAGAKYKNPECTLHRLFLAEIAPDANPWNSPSLAQQSAAGLVSEQRADMLFAVAGGSNLGVFRAAKDASVNAIGVDTDQDFMAKGVILTSVMKRMDVALEQVLQAIMQQEFDNKRYAFSLKNHGVGLSPMQYSKAAIPAPLLQELEVLRAKIVSGEIQVPSSQ